MRYAAGSLIVTLALAACVVQTRPPAAKDVSAEYKAFINQAHDHLKSRGYGPAMSLLERAIALRPDAANAYNMLGIAYFLQENLGLAEENFLKAVSCQEDYAAAYNNLGNVHFLQGNAERAKDDFKKALSFSPDSAAANYSLATLLLSQGRYEEGLTYLSRGIALDPDYLEEHKDFTAGVALGGLDSPETYFSWARAYALQGDAPRTVEYLEKARVAGFREWKRLDTMNDFDKVRNSPELMKFRQDL